jgi:hypothetical protein
MAVERQARFIMQNYLIIFLIKRRHGIEAGFIHPYGCFDQVIHKILAYEIFFFKTGPIKLELRDNFSRQQIIDNFFDNFLTNQLNKRFYSIYLKKTHYY